MIADGVEKTKIQALAELQGQPKMVDVGDARNLVSQSTGADLIAKGMKPFRNGCSFGQLKQKWKASNFTATKDDLLSEKITKIHPMGDVIDDRHTKAMQSQFKGKSKKKRREMANTLLMESLFEDLDPKAELYVDMDGVLADFYGVWNKMMGVKH